MLNQIQRDQATVAIDTDEAVTAKIRSSENNVMQELQVVR
jgi:hypothetical protein